MKSSHIIALVLAVGVAGWILSGQFGESGPPAQAGDPQTANAAPDKAIPRVQTRVLHAQDLVSDIVLTGRTESFRDGVLQFAPDLAGNIARGDAYYLALLDEADAFAARNGLTLPEEPEARMIGPDPDCVAHPLRELDLKAANVTSIIWATGFAFDFGWLKIDSFDERGAPLHQRGAAREPGVYFLGLPWQTRRGSSFIWGVWYDAKYVADHIEKQRNYLHYTPSSEGNA